MATGMATEKVGSERDRQVGRSVGETLNLTGFSKIVAPARLAT
jgi:hypothetical protein